MATTSCAVPKDAVVSNRKALGEGTRRRQNKKIIITVCIFNKWDFSWVFKLTLDFCKTGLGHILTEVNQRAFWLASREDIVVIGHSNAMGSHVVASLALTCSHFHCPRCTVQSLAAVHIKLLKSEVQDGFLAALLAPLETSHNEDRWSFRWERFRRGN